MKHNILVSTICFINHAKLQLGSDIYATFCNRLINDVMTKTPFDIKVATNEMSFFQETKDKWGDRVIIDICGQNNRVAVGAFNQLLKYLALRNAPEEKYQWVMYLDCDAGLDITQLDIEKLDECLDNILSRGADMVAQRVNAYVHYHLGAHEEVLRKRKENEEKGVDEWVPNDLFHTKWTFYNLTTENIDPLWLDAQMPSEHFLLMRNYNGKLPIMSQRISDFNDILEAQEHPWFIADMEAFEIGVGAKVAGYTMISDDWFVYNVLGAKCNFNNWEKVKL